MTGDRLKALEQGFLEGTLSDEEELSLKKEVLSTEGHPLRPYFEWTTDSIDETVPDFREHIGSVRPAWYKPYYKIAAAILVLLTAGFLFRGSLFQNSSDQFSQSEIDKSYEATIETLSAMASFLDNGFKEAREGINLSKPFEDLEELKNDNSK